MVMEKVKEIKSAEEKADTIIRRAQERAEGIAASLEAEVNDLRDAEEKQRSVEIRRYRESSDKKTEDRMNVLRHEHLHKSAGIKEKSERKIASVAESAWKELKNTLSMP